MTEETKGTMGPENDECYLNIIVAGMSGAGKSSFIANHNGRDENGNIPIFSYGSSVTK